MITFHPREILDEPYENYPAENDPIDSDTPVFAKRPENSAKLQPSSSFPTLCVGTNTNHCVACAKFNL